MIICVVTIIYTGIMIIIKGITIQNIATNKLPMLGKVSFRIFLRLLRINSKVDAAVMNPSIIANLNVSTLFFQSIIRMPIGSKHKTRENIAKMYSRIASFTALFRGYSIETILVIKEPYRSNSDKGRR